MDEAVVEAAEVVTAVKVENDIPRDKAFVIGFRRFHRDAGQGIDEVGGRMDGTEVGDASVEVVLHTVNKGKKTGFEVAVRLIHDAFTVRIQTFADNPFIVRCGVRPSARIVAEVIEFAHGSGGLGTFLFQFVPVNLVGQRKLGGNGESGAEVFGIGRIQTFAFVIDRRCSVFQITRVGDGMTVEAVFFRLLKQSGGIRLTDAVE